MMPCPRCKDSGRPGYVRSAGNRIYRPCTSCEGGVITESMATQDDADREIEALRTRVRELEAERDEALSHGVGIFNTLTETERRVERVLTYVRAHPELSDSAAMKQIDQLLTGKVIGSVGASVSVEEEEAQRRAWETLWRKPDGLGCPERLDEIIKGRQL